jgi:hypothetical protein
MRLFRESTTQPLSDSVLQTPLHKPKPPSAAAASRAANLVSPRESPRLKAKLTKEKYISKLAQDLVAKKCGVIQQDQLLDDMTLNEYIQLYKKAPL